MENKISITFAAYSVNESFARVAAAAFAAPLDPNIEELSDIRTAVSEAVTNAIVHGYDGQEGNVVMEMERDGQRLTYRISDEGLGIADIAAAMRPLYTSKPGPERSGMGFTVMESFMDTLQVTSAPHVGTTVTMTKEIHG